MSKPSAPLSVIKRLTLFLLLLFTLPLQAQDAPTATPTPSPTPTLDYLNEELVVYQIDSDSGIILWGGLDEESPAIIATVRPASLVFEAGEQIEYSQLVWQQIMTFDRITGWVDAQSLVNGLMPLPQEWEAGQEVTINADNIWLRTEADPDSEDILDVLPINTPLYIIGNNHFDGLQWWWPVITENNTLGWIEERWLAGDETADNIVFATATVNSQSAPQPTSASVTNCTVRTDMDTYTIVSGDSLWQIATLHNIGLQQLLDYNCLQEDSVIRAGQVLYVPQAIQQNTFQQPTSVPPTAIPPTSINYFDSTTPTAYNPSSPDNYNETYPTEPPNNTAIDPSSQDGYNETYPTEPPSQNNFNSSNNTANNPSSQDDYNEGDPIKKDPTIVPPPTTAPAPRICISSVNLTTVRVTVDHAVPGVTTYVTIYTTGSNINKSSSSSSFNVDISVPFGSILTGVRAAHDNWAVQYNSPILSTKCNY